MLELKSLDNAFPPFVFLHSPFEYPIHFQKEQLNAFELSQSYSYDVLIAPEIITTNDDLKGLKVNQRKCFMDEERKLKFFKIYSQRNCEIECLAYKLLKTCKCVPFDIIRSNETTICELYDYICVHKVQNEILLDEESQNACNCLQPCNFITYYFEFTEAKLSERRAGSSIKINFKEKEFVTLQRIRQFTILDFLSYIGGLLGLFAGISVLSFFEIFYFFTLRLICEVLNGIRKMRRIGSENIFVVAP